MVKIQEYTADYLSESNGSRRWLTKLTAPSKNPKKYYLKSSNPHELPIYREDIFPFFIKYEGKFMPEKAAGGGIPGEADMLNYYTLVPSVTAYIRKIGVALPDTRRKFPSIEIFLQDAEDQEYFKIEGTQSGSFANHVCINLNHPDADFSKPFTFYFYKKPNKNDPSGKDFYVNTNISQPHLPQRNGRAGTLFLNLKGVMPRGRNTEGNMVDNWYADDWGELTKFFGDKYQGTPLREGLIALINEKAIAALGHPPTEDEMIAALNGDSDSDSSYESYDEEEENEYPPTPLSGFSPTPPAAPATTSSAPAAYATPVVGAPPSVNSLFTNATIVTPPEEESEATVLAGLIAKAGWSPAIISSFYNMFGCPPSGNRDLSLITTGKMKEAIAYVEKMIAFYAEAAKLNPTVYALNNKPYGDWAVGILARRELVGIADLDGAIPALQDLQVNF